MKNTFKITLIILTLFACQVGSCQNRNNPNLSDQRLKELLNDSTVFPKREQLSATVFPDLSYIPPVGAKYTEIRAVDPSFPPVTLKVSASGASKQQLKLSRFGSSVEYVILKLPDEKDFFLSETSVRRIYGQSSTSSRHTTQVNMLGDHFITSDAFGIRLFGPTGNLVQNLLISEFEGQRNIQRVEINFDGSKNAILRDFSGTRCFLTFVDYAERKIWAGEFNLENVPLIMPQSEITPSPRGLEMAPVRTAPQGKNIDNDTRFNFRGGGDPLAISFNNMGDTLCKFTNHVRLEEGQKMGLANSDRSFSYQSAGELFFRQAYCDTVFRVQSANRIVPAYCFDFGNQRASLFEGSTMKTQGKLLPWKWIDLKNEIILIFTEGRDCPNCRNNNEVTFHCLLFDKRTGKPTPIDMKSRYPEHALIENDIDGRLPLPLNTLNTEGHFIIATYTKVQIEEMLKNNARNFRQETIAQLKELAETLKQNEMLVLKIKSINSNN